MEAHERHSEDPSVRLSMQYRQAILEEAQKSFGDGVRVFLFGSRTNRERKGGDIDLLIVPKDSSSQQADGLFSSRLSFLSALYRRLGEQKIDVILAGDLEQDSEQRIMETGVIL